MCSSFVAQLVGLLSQVRTDVQACKRRAAFLQVSGVIAIAVLCLAVAAAERRLLQGEQRSPPYTQSVWTFCAVG